MREPVIVINGFSDKYTQKFSQILAVLPENLAIRKMIFLCDEKYSEETLRRFPVELVQVVSCPVYDPEKILPALEELTKDEMWVLFDSGYSAEELAVRLAARKGGTGVTKVQDIFDQEGKWYFQKMVYANHMMGTFQITRWPCCLSLAPGGKERETSFEADTARVQILSLESSIMGYHLEKTEKEKGLENASFLLAAGRGAGSRENVCELEKLARKMGADFGVSRPAAMSAWAPMNCLVGVSGAMTKPKICIAAGASGAPAFYAGIEKSEFIVGINTDASAELVKKSDVSVVGDCMEVLRELEQVMEEDRKETAKCIAVERNE